MAENPCGEENRVGVATRWTTDAGAVPGEAYDYLDRPKSFKAWNQSGGSLEARCTDLTPEPDTTVEENGIIDVLVKVHEGGQ